MYYIGYLISIIIFIGISYCFFTALKKYKIRTGKKGIVFSTYDLFRFNKEELLWFIISMLLFLTLLPIFIIFFW